MKNTKKITLGIFLFAVSMTASATALPLEDLKTACNGPANSANSLACIKLSRTLLKANRVF